MPRLEHAVRNSNMDGKGVGSTPYASIVSNVSRVYGVLAWLVFISYAPFIPYEVYEDPRQTTSQYHLSRKVRILRSGHVHRMQERYEGWISGVGPESQAPKSVGMWLCIIM